MIDKKRLVHTFKKLVRIDSPSLKEGKIIKHLKKEIRALGLRPYEGGKPGKGEAANLVVDVPGIGRNGPRVLLNAHVDTVAPGKGIKPVEKKGYIYSDGTTILGADDKSGVTAILEVLRILRKKKMEHPPLQVVFTVSEEIGLFGAKALPKKLLNVDFVSVLDGGDVREIIYKAPAQYNLTATVIGKAAHAGIRPEAGINAIKVASVAIARMKFGRIDKETTSNIGVIKGGKATNIIPSEVTIKGEARSHDPKKLKRQIDHMKNVLVKTCKKFKARIKIKTKLVYGSFEVKKNSPVLRLAVSAARKVGVRPILKKTGGGSDANIFNADGIPTIIMASGMEQVHTYSERLRIRDLLKGTEMLLGLIRSIGK